MRNVPLLALRNWRCFVSHAVTPTKTFVIENLGKIQAKVDQKLVFVDVIVEMI